MYYERYYAGDIAAKTVRFLIDEGKSEYHARGQRRRTSGTHKKQP